MLSKADAKADKLHKNLFQISQRFQHPDYLSPMQDNDIALYKLEEPVTFNEFIRPICLAAPATATFSDILGQTPFVTGWGRLEPGYTFSFTVRIRRGEV
jgi:hypothetical protein